MAPVLRLFWLLCTIFCFPPKILWKMCCFSLKNYKLFSMILLFFWLLWEICCSSLKNEDAASSDCDANELPLRVVHIKETLRKGQIIFYKPTGWDFHVISHTWSKGLRDLSEKIGKLIDDIHGSSASSSTHDLAFLDADMANEPCFEALMQFLDLLSADGVDAIWIDALCINQTDMAEKSREIGRMAEYYRNSKACYVLTHGIDQGYKMWKKRGEVPRWFNRVWTLQELLLPKDIFFIVTDYHPSTIHRLKVCVLEWGSSYVGVCRCVLFKFYENRFIATLGRSRHFKGIDPERISVSGIQQCGECKSKTLIREVCMRLCYTAKLGGKLAKDNLKQPHYIVERSAYLHLAYQECMFNSSNDRGGQLFRQLRELLEQDQVLNPRLVITQISKRECSQEEDRVLSILGLIKAQHTRQLRADKKLREQFIDLAKGKLQSNDQGFLIEMMTTDMQGCDNMGPNLSWAPDFITSGKSRLPEWISRDYTGERFTRCVEVREITEEGKLRLDGAKLARVRMSVNMSVSISSLCVTQILISSSPGFKIAYSRSLYPAGEFSIVGRNPSILKGPTLALMCLSKIVNDAPHDLHKIGLFRFHWDIERLVSDLPSISCSLAGSEGGLEDGYFNCSLPHPRLKWIIDKQDTGVGLIGERHSDEKIWFH